MCEGEGVVCVCVCVCVCVKGCRAMCVCDELYVSASVCRTHTHVCGRYYRSGTRVGGRYYRDLELRGEELSELRDRQVALESELSGARGEKEAFDTALRTLKDDMAQVRVWEAGMRAGREVCVQERVRVREGGMRAGEGACVRWWCTCPSVCVSEATFGTALHTLKDDTVQVRGWEPGMRAVEGVHVGRAGREVCVQGTGACAWGRELSV